MKTPTPIESKAGALSKRQNDTAGITLVAIDKSALNLIVNALCVALFAGLTALGLHVVAVIQGVT